MRGFKGSILLTHILLLQLGVDEQDEDDSRIEFSPGVLSEQSNICGNRRASDGDSERETRFAKRDRVVVRGNRPRAPHAGRRGNQAEQSNIPAQHHQQIHYGATRVTGAATTVGGVHVVGTGGTQPPPRRRRLDNGRGNDGDGNKRRKVIRRVIQFCELFSILLVVCVMAISGILIYDHHPGDRRSSVYTLTSPKDMNLLILPTNSTYTFTINNSETFSYINYSLNSTVSEDDWIKVDFRICDPEKQFEPVKQTFQINNYEDSPVCILQDHKKLSMNCFIIRHWPKSIHYHIKGSIGCKTVDSPHQKVYLVWESVSTLNTDHDVYHSVNCEKNLRKIGEWYHCNGSASEKDISDILKLRDGDDDVFILRFCRDKKNSKVEDRALIEYTVLINEYHYDYELPDMNHYTIDTTKEQNSVLVPVSDGSSVNGDISVCISVMSSGKVGLDGPYGTQPIKINRMGIPSMQYVNEQMASEKVTISVFNGALIIAVVTVVLFSVLVFMYLLLLKH